MGVICGIVILLTDQLSKRALESRRWSLNLPWSNVAQVRFVAHRDSSYDGTATRVVLVFLWVLAVVCTIMVCQQGAWFRSGSSRAGVALALGGAASNLLDILRYRYIVDFIDLGWWPVFNLADVGIVAGLAAAFCL
jgi:signal peptidase II